MAARCNIDVRFFPPPPELDGCFSTFYRAIFTMPDGERVKDYLQPEWGNMRFFRGDAPDAQVAGGDRLSRARFTATGPSALPTEFHLGTTRMWGVGLFPLGWAKFMLAPAGELANGLVDGETHPAYANFADLAANLFEDEPDDEREYCRLLGRFLELNRPHPDQDRIIAVHAALVDPALVSVSEMADRAGLSQRTLERLCRRAFGFSPKRLLRRQRFMRSLAAFMLAKGTERSWSDAIDPHYHDQAHFVRDFRAFMTMSPRQYAALEHPILTAFMPERARIWGSPAQTLDRPER
ncbi:MAG: helix-turn-helix domain-containing protein [Novosphingobium sp.]|nr:helix-turn-helix domain-containing protein [Novosphingobium sp.]